jgi:stage III sporulation protein AD
MIKIASVCIISVIIIQITKSFRSEYGLLVKLCSVVVIGFLIVSEFASFTDGYYFISGQNPEIEAFLPILIKTLSVALITEFASSVCRDSGESALQTVVELSGKLSILIICLPVFEALYTLTTGLLEV